MNPTHFIVITRVRVAKIEGGAEFVYDSSFVRHPSATAAHRSASRTLDDTDYLVGQVVNGKLADIDVINFDVEERIRIARQLGLHQDSPTKVTGDELLDDPDKQYITCQGSDLETLSAGVNSAMRKDWVPQGGICTTHLADTRAFLYVQALVRPRKYTTSCNVVNTAGPEKP